MKLFRFNILSAMALPVAAAMALTSCDGYSSPAYNMAAMPEGPRVYFASQSVREVVDDGATSVSVPVYRPAEVADSAVTVMLDSTDPSHMFSVPAEVTFAVGQTEAEISVGLTADDMEVSRPYQVLISVNPAQANEYGIDAVTLTVVHESWTEWAELGTGTFTLDAWYGEEEAELNQVPGAAMVRYLTTDSAAMQFEFYAALGYHYGDDTLYPYFEAETRDGGATLDIPAYEVGQHPSYGTVWQEEAGAGRSTYDAEKDLFTFNIVCYVGAGSFGTFTEYFQLGADEPEEAAAAAKAPHRSLRSARL